MNAAAEGITCFFAAKTARRFLYLCLLGIAALAEFFYGGLVRRTFVFYTVTDGHPVVEDRMLVHGESREEDVRRYVEEALWGPVSLDAAPLFPRETGLRSLLYREGAVYADLTPQAALPPEEPGERPPEGSVFRGFYTLNQGLRRNFPFVRDVRLFINGKEVFFEKFSEIFADN